MEEALLKIADAPLALVAYDGYSISMNNANRPAAKTYSDITLVLTDPNQPSRCYPADATTLAGIRSELGALAKGVLRGGSAVAQDADGNIIASVLC